MAPEIIVIGAGVSGLSCAIELADAGRRVEVWTAIPSAQTTSSVAAAFWYPYWAEPIERVGPWAAVSYRRFASMAADPTLGPASAVVMREAIEVFDEPVDDPPWSRYVGSFRHARADELPPGYVDGIVFEAPVVEMTGYLGWLGARADALGVVTRMRELDSLAPALAAASVVVKCSGLGARELVGDARVYAVRGQVVRRRRDPGVDRVVLDEHGPRGMTYIIPRGTDVVLGGVADEHVEDLDVDPAQTEAIVARCVRLVPALADAEPLDVRVGLRPCRDVVRLDQEQLDGKLVVHNYGHGGAGVTLSWGCAEDVRDRVLAWRGR